MLTLSCKLSQLNEDGSVLVRLTRNDDFPTIQGATVRMNKFSYVNLRSLITRTERAERFASNSPVAGRKHLRTSPLTDTEKDRLSKTVSVYGDVDDSIYTFAPVRQLYEGDWRGRDNHARSMRGESDAETINNLGSYFRWFLTEGGFTPIAPRQIDRLYHFMKDGRWRTLAEIERSTGIPAASASAQLRNLRKIGTNFSKRPRGDRSQGLWEYRLEARNGTV